MTVLELTVELAKYPHSAEVSVGRLRRDVNKAWVAELCIGDKALPYTLLLERVYCAPT